MRDNAGVGQSVVQLLVAAVAAAASLTAVLMGIDQLSSGGRLRNLESVLRAAVATPDGTGRDEVLASLHRSTLGRLIAREAVPFRSYLVPSMLPILSVMGPIDAVFLPFPWWGQALTVIVSGAFMGAGLQQILYLAAERIRIRSWFEDGITPLRVFTHGFPSWLRRRHGRLVHVAYAEGILGTACTYFGLQGWKTSTALLSWHSLIFGLLFSIAGSSFAMLTSILIGSVNGSVTLSRRGPHYEPTWVHPSVEALWLPSPRRVKGS